MKSTLQQYQARNTNHEFVSREVEKISKRERKNVRLNTIGSGLSVETIVGSEKKQKDSDASELKRLDARKVLQEDRDGARETQIERFRSSAP
eukprot:g53315.t1